MAASLILDLSTVKRKLVESLPDDMPQFRDV